VKQEQKLAIPIATLIILLFGAPLATSSKRGGTAYGVAVSLGSTMLYLLMLKIAGGFGASGALPPFWAAWLPNLLFLAVGVVLIRRVRT
jgi:lipopolysaccharide export system permease protein